MVAARQVVAVVILAVVRLLNAKPCCQNLLLSPAWPLPASAANCTSLQSGRRMAIQPSRYDYHDSVDDPNRALVNCTVHDAAAFSEWVNALTMQVVSSCSNETVQCAVVERGSRLQTAVGGIPLSDDREIDLCWSFYTNVNLANRTCGLDGDLQTTALSGCRISVPLHLSTPLVEDTTVTFFRAFLAYSNGSGRDDDRSNGYVAAALLIILLVCTILFVVAVAACICCCCLAGACCRRRKPQQAVPNRAPPPLLPQVLVSPGAYPMSTIPAMEEPPPDYMTATTSPSKMAT